MGLSKLLLAGLCSSFAIGALLAANVGALSTAEVESRLENGVYTVHVKDAYCNQFFRETQSNNPSITFRFDSTGRGPLRELIEGKYGATGDAWDAWVSESGKPNTILPSSVPFGSTTVDLQLNVYHFWCAQHVMPDVDNRTATYANRIANTWNEAISPNSRWVKSSADAKDGTPQPVGTRWFERRKTFELMQVQNIQIVSDVSQATGQPYTGGALSPNYNGEVVNMTLNTDSRYTIATPRSLQYTNTANPITSQRKIVFRLSYKEIGVFDSYNHATAINACGIGGTVTVIPTRSFLRCDVQTKLFSIVVGPDADFDLTPQVSADPASISEGGSVTASPSMDAAAKPISASPPVPWTLTRFVLDPGVDYSTSPLAGGRSACGAFGGYRAGSCDEIGGGKQAFRAGRVTVLPPVAETPPATVGMKICYIASVNPPNQTNNPRWRHSAPSCVLVTRTPSVSVSGADVMVGRGPLGTNSHVVTLSRIVQGLRYGSWAEYGIFATGDVYSSSGAVLSREGGRNPGLSRSQLTFANTPANGRFGALGERQSFSGIGEGLVTQPAGTSIDFSGATGKKRYTVSGTVRVGGNVGSGVTAFVDNPSGTIIVDSDIVYANGPYATLSSLPQVILRANKIIIVDTVARVDAWLIGKDGSQASAVSTCNDTASPYYSGLTSAVCSAPLQINGPVSSSELQLRRTYGLLGADPKTSLGKNAENIDLRADAYLWAYGRADSQGMIRTTYVQEIAPRF